MTLGDLATGRVSLDPELEDLEEASEWAAQMVRFYALWSLMVLSNFRPIEIEIDAEADVAASL